MLSTAIAIKAVSIKRNTVNIYLVSSKENKTTTCTSLYRIEDMH